MTPANGMRTDTARFSPTLLVATPLSVYSDLHHSAPDHTHEHSKTLQRKNDFVRFRLPPMILIHGGCDTVVDNSSSSLFALAVSTRYQDEQFCFEQSCVSSTQDRDGPNAVISVPIMFNKYGQPKPNASLEMQSVQPEMPHVFLHVLDKSDHGSLVTDLILNEGDASTIIDLIRCFVDDELKLVSMPLPAIVHVTSKL